MYKKYVRLLFLIVVSMVYIGCSEEPFDWSGDSERSVPKPVDLSLTMEGNSVYAKCTVEYQGDDLPILEVGFFYGKTPDVDYDSGIHVKSKINDDAFASIWSDIFPGEDGSIFCYAGAYITTSRGVVTIGPEYVGRY